MTSIAGIEITGAEIADIDHIGLVLHVLRTIN